ncbi:unnamed protein product [Brassica rapa]|uniref:Uncharacterized protein n=1 Tax=Brassica campestris TaxID=3711 RepID=A0A8D9MBW9_BRACM|nr:unnamed protein product [Brassica rapa]
MEIKFFFHRESNVVFLVTGFSSGLVAEIISKSLPRKRGRPITKNVVKKHVDIANVVQLLASKEAQDEVLKCEEVKKEAGVRLTSLYDEIRPAIEEHERDSQDSVATSVAEKWIQASCYKLKAEFDLYSCAGPPPNLPGRHCSCVIKNIACTPIKPRDSTKIKAAEAGSDNNQTKLSES